MYTCSYDPSHLFCITALFCFIIFLSYRQDTQQFIRIRKSTSTRTSTMAKTNRPPPPHQGSNRTQNYVYYRRRRSLEKWEIQSPYPMNHDRRPHFLDLFSISLYLSHSLSHSPGPQKDTPTWWTTPKDASQVRKLT